MNYDEYGGFLSDGWEPQLWKKGYYQIKRESYNYFIPSYHADKKVIKLDARDSLEKAMMACSDHKYERKI